MTIDEILEKMKVTAEQIVCLQNELKVLDRELEKQVEGLSEYYQNNPMQGGE